jgi:hypothetical protein
MGDFFIYDNTTSSLYGPDGQFIKKVFCPKGKKWNQLVANDPEDRSRGCEDCSERVINLDVINPTLALDIFKMDDETCVYASLSGPNVIFLHNRKDPKARIIGFDDLDEWDFQSTNGGDIPVIMTARTIDDINRAATEGFWPDVRLITYKDDEISELLHLGQHNTTGVICDLGNGRFSPIAGEEDQWTTVIESTYFYQHYQERPVAAYLIPLDLPDGSEVLIPDPIEDFVGYDHPTGVSKATHVKGVVRGRQVEIDLSSIQQGHICG